ncbi:MAG: hypothetical protein HYT87_03650 [Nitrospirae bacterium]|nr:hypothetical protein [Nitrospirota bacterium]
MKRFGAVEKNLDLAHLFLLYTLEHPDLLDLIPPGAEVVFLPAQDRKLLAINKRLAQSLRRKGRRVVTFHVRPVRRETAEFLPEAA